MIWLRVCSFVTLVTLRIHFIKLLSSQIASPSRCLYQLAINNEVLMAVSNINLAQPGGMLDAWMRNVSFCMGDCTAIGERDGILYA